MHYRVRLDCNTTVTGMERDPAGEGWILHTIKSTTSSIYKEVAREEAFDFVINAAGAGSAKIANLGCNSIDIRNLRLELGRKLRQGLRTTWFQRH